MAKDICVLLTGCGAPGAPGIIKCLRKNGERNIRIVGVDMNENAGGRGLVDVFYTIPAAKDEEFIPAILDICGKEKVDVVEPIVTRELMKFAKAKPLFDSEGIKVVVMAPETLEIVNNKAHLLYEMKKVGISTPDFVIVHTLDELIEACKTLGYPEKAICVKGAVGNGSRGVRIVDAAVSKYDLFFNEKPNSMYISYDELIRTLGERPGIPEMLVMEYLPGEEFGVDVLCDNGRVICEVGRYNYSVNSSIPQGCIIEEREQPFKLARQICEAFMIDGNANFDFKYNCDGEAMLIEINPRLSATIVSYAAAGINLPYFGIKHLLGEELPKYKINNGTRMSRRYQETFFDKEGNVIEW